MSDIAQDQATAEKGDGTALHAGYVSIAEITIDASASVVWAHVIDMGSWIYDIHFEHVSGGIDAEGEVEHLWPIGAEELGGPKTIAAPDRTLANATVLKTLTLIPGKLWYGINPPKVHDGLVTTGVNLVLLTERNGKTKVTAIRSKEAISPAAEMRDVTEQNMLKYQPIAQRRWMGKYLPRLKALAEAAARTAVAKPVKSPAREMTFENLYLNLPIENGATKRRMTILVGGTVVREFYIELADEKPDWWAFADISPFKKQRAVIQVDELPEGSNALTSIGQSDDIVESKSTYREKSRPQFHFSARRGFTSDVNGLVFYEGEYHLFYQHNPYGREWGNVHWGHAVSADLVHWQEMPVALYPDEHGIMFSGSAVIDEMNTAKLQTGIDKTMVAIFTAAPISGMDLSEQPSLKKYTQGIAFSNDRGRTWTKYEGNPVLPHIIGLNRDPRVFWFEPEKKWVMALYLDKVGPPPGIETPEENGYGLFGLFASIDLKSWTKLSELILPGDRECPEFFEIAVDGNQNNRRWIFYGGNGTYLIGSFDGKNFVLESGPHRLHAGNSFYASQTFNDIPSEDGRRILISWGVSRGDFHMKNPTSEPVLYREMPFNQMMGIPVELTLRTTSSGLRLLAFPVKEMAKLRTRAYKFDDHELREEGNPLAGIRGELLEILAEVSVGEADEIALSMRGVPIIYDVKKQELACAGKRGALAVENGVIRLRVLVDRTSIDIFGNDGRLYMPMSVSIPADDTGVGIDAKGNGAQVRTLQVFELKSIWP